MIPRKTGLFPQFNIPQSGREYDRSVWGCDLSYSPVNARNQAASTQYHFVTVTDPHNKTDERFVMLGRFEESISLFLLPFFKWKLRPCDPCEISAINIENSFPLPPFHDTLFLLISPVHGLFANGMLSTWSARTLKDTLAHCFCLKWSLFLPLL